MVGRQVFWRVADEVVYAVSGTHGVPRRARAFSCNSSLRITATNATLPGFPALAQVLVETAQLALHLDHGAGTEVQSFADYAPSAANCSVAQMRPLSRDQGAKPTREVSALLSHWPSSGRKATKVAAVSGPTPGTVRYSAARLAN